MKNTFHSENNRKPIGFKVTDNKVAIYETQNVNFTQTNDIDFEEQMKLKGMEQGIKLIRQYFSNAYPLMNEYQRETKFFSELRNIRNRFFGQML